MRLYSYFLPTTKKGLLSVFLIWLVTISGIIGISQGMAEWFLPKTPFNLLMGAGLLLWNFPPQRTWQGVAIWSIVFLGGMLAETLGVQYGLFFGAYHYGDNLGPSLFGVPLLIGINWMITTFLTAYCSKLVFQDKWKSAVLGAFLMLLLDVLIEPVAPLLGFWYWDAGFAPLQNYVTWFSLGLAFQLLVHNRIPGKIDPLPAHQLVSQFIFFGFCYVLLYL
jgi:putative membrane protein